MWRLVALSSACIAATYGLGMYLFPALAPAMIADIPFTYGAIGASTGPIQVCFLAAALVFAFGNVARGLGGILGNGAGGWLKEAFGTLEGLYTMILMAAAGAALTGVALTRERPAPAGGDGRR